jgi:hypothetical protein
MNTNHTSASNFPIYVDPEFRTRQNNTNQAQAQGQATRRKPLREIHSNIIINRPGNTQPRPITRL